MYKLISFLKFKNNLINLNLHYFKQTMFLLPNDILYYIFRILDISDRSKLLFLNKRQFFKKLIDKDYNSIIKIQKFYKNNLPRLPISQHYNTTYNRLFTKNMLIRMYIANYPMNFLVKLPETYVQSMKKSQSLYWGINLEYNNDQILDQLTRWINENLPDVVYNRTRRDIRKFLNHPKVTKNGISYTGW